MSEDSEELSRALARIRQLESEIVDIADCERRRLSADLHDGLGQELTGIALILRALVNRADAAAPIAAQLQEIIGLVNHALEGVRSLSFGLSPATIGPEGLPAALQTLIAWSRAWCSRSVRRRTSPTRRRGASPTQRRGASPTQRRGTSI
jgi:signal transduction histidine kinase